MVYLKNYKKREKKKNYVVIIFFLIICFEVAVTTFNKLRGENDESRNRSESIIENAMNYVVGVSKDNGVLEDSKQTWGSGVIVSKSGYILTNAHVSGSRGSICKIVVDSDNKFNGNVIWSNDNLDLAIIKTNKNFSSCISFGDSNNIKVGQNVYTIGNPINSSFQKSIGKGIISGLNRSLEFEEDGKKYYMTDLVQTDAVINYGNSGGALIDEAGNLIGISTMKISNAELMGFCVKVNVVKPVINKIEQDGQFTEPSLRIWCYDKYTIRDAEITAKVNTGLYVAKIENESNAEKSGLRVGDIVTYVDTQELQSVNELKEYVFSKSVNDNVILKINRDNKEILINIRLQNST